MANPEVDSLISLGNKINSLAGESGGAQFLLRADDKRSRSQIIEVVSFSKVSRVTVWEADPVLHPLGFELFPYRGIDIATQKKVFRPRSGIKIRNTDGSFIEWREDADSPNTEMLSGEKSSSLEQYDFSKGEKEFALDPNQYKEYLHSVNNDNRLNRYGMTDKERDDHLSASASFHEATEKLMERARQRGNIDYRENPRGYITHPFRLQEDPNEDAGLQFAVRVALEDDFTHLMPNTVYLTMDGENGDIPMGSYKVREDMRVGFKFPSWVHDRPISAERVSAFTKLLRQAR